MRTEVGSRLHLIHACTQLILRTCATLAHAGYETYERPAGMDPDGCGVFHSPYPNSRPVVLHVTVPLNSRSTAANRGRGRARSAATLLAGRDRGSGLQE